MRDPVSFGGPINEPLDGTGAGVMYLDGSVWYTCSHNLWHLQDTMGAGVADVREKVLTGFGVQTALRRALHSRPGRRARRPHLLVDW